MYILEPISKERIWGTPRLHGYNGAEEIERIGSVYSASAIAEIDCRLEEFEGNITLGKLIKDNPAAFGLCEGEVYPLIISFTACDDNLSIQVHPTDDFAQKNEGMPYGKSEAWYFLSSPEAGWIYAGQQLKDKNRIEAAVKDNQYKDVLNEYSVTEKELIYIPSGTIHALTKGSLVYEIQQATDITYRFYDYDRKDQNGKKRELHVEKALSTLIPQQEVKKDTFLIGQEAKFREFSITHFIPENVLENPNNIASIVTVLSGEIIVENSTLTAGRSLLLMPKEKVQVQGSGECVLAVPYRYWGK
ncbi:class I mannose-6-phosphate isomerase [Enterococcus sp. CWB-B31]|uniref:class I mannose-6-phosphate isomerase n=1 Tax=Enterococcus sp. CWB-B31 TaxID=2885159 RepID=UPI001E2E70F8|nr:class I mannose-6-phosphate isomerase [Enterococcus sp. CWB-B31]MCB5953816.1 class I mannose-6-phosphate isomerase [Enterococcus sp. CWB-B31]